MEKLAAYYNGQEIKRGDPVTDFRGETRIFRTATRRAEEGRAGKVAVSLPGESQSTREVYAGVIPGLHVHVTGP